MPPRTSAPPADDAEDEPERVLTVDEPDEVDWLDSGGVRFRFDGETYTLRAPKLEGVIWLMETLAEFDAQNSALATGKTKPVAQVQLVVKTLRAIFGKFSNDVLPAKDANLPAFFSNPNLLGQIATHFRAIPLGSGG